MGEALKRIAVVANLVVGPNFATTLGGKSAPLSSGQDRGRFHSLRATADLILIGGETARVEPYGKTPCALAVLTRGEDLGRAATNPLAYLEHRTLAEIIAETKSQEKVLLIESGVKILHEIMNLGLLDELHLTVGSVGGDGNFFDEDLLQKNLTITSEEIAGDDRFQIWRTNSTH